MCGSQNLDLLSHKHLTKPAQCGFLDKHTAITNLSHYVLPSDNLTPQKLTTFHRVILYDDDMLLIETEQVLISSASFTTQKQAC